MKAFIQRFAASAIAFGCVALAVPQADQSVIDKVIQEGKTNNQVMKHLQYLTKRIGHRLTGSDSLQRACEWTAAQFKKYGLQNVALEKWGEIPVGYQRYGKQSARMVAPYEHIFEFTSPAWTPGTNGPMRGPAVYQPTTMAEFEKVKTKLKGAWMIVTTGPTGGGRGAAQPELTDDQKALNDAIAKSGILGRVTGSRNELVITSGRFAGLTWETLPTERRMIVRKSDMDMIRYNLDKGRDVQLEFEVTMKWLRGPRPIYNVVAEIPGTEKPEEVVIVSGHLDSWDGPGNEGACDNGTGTMVALEAARLLMKAGAKPKRTIRFIMWTGEEQGLHGSRAYVEMHKDKLDKISAVFVDDGGTNYEGGLTCLESMKPILEEAIAPARKAFPEFPMEIRTASRMPRGGGSDHAPFNAVGVPGFFWMETGRADYNYVHHTQHDKYEQAIPEYLIQSSVNAACASYIVACAPTMLPREQVAQPTTPPPGGNR